jgi:uncharacterized protein YqgV (UPF0045/DUF77 family)
MVITTEISYYPLSSDFENPVAEFLERLQSIDDIEIQIGSMSTLVTGHYDQVMAAISSTIKPLMVKHPSVFTLKVSNACQRL